MWLGDAASAKARRATTQVGGQTRSTRRLLTARNCVVCFSTSLECRGAVRLLGHEEPRAPRCCSTGPLLGASAGYPVRSFQGT